MKIISRLQRVIVTGALSASLLFPVSSALSPVQAKAVENAPAISWQQCPERVKIPNAQCGSIEVPLEYSDPAGPKISVGFVRLPATGSSRGSIFMNPGGPGGDAFAMVAGETEGAFKWPAALRSEWDLVGVQPRGLVDSTPLECTELPDDFNPIQLITGPAGVIKATCDKSHPGLAASLTTTNVAKDWEEARKALGLKEISIYGLSYGTQLGSTYATLFPKNVDKLVLDSGYNHQEIWNGVMQNQNSGYVQSLHEFLSWVAANDATYHLGTTPLAVYQAWSRKVVSESGTNPTVVPPPATIDDLPPGLQVAGKPAADALSALGSPRVQLEGLFSQITHPGANQSKSETLILTRLLIPQPSLWPKLARLINGSEQPAATPDFESPEGEKLAKEILSFQTAQRMVICNENQVMPRMDQLPSWVWTNLVTGDLFQGTTDTFTSGRFCDGITPNAELVPVTGANLRHRPLQLQGTSDPQTPYWSFSELAAAMGSQVITVHGPGHGQFGLGNQVVDDAVLNYLRTGHANITEASGRTPADLK
ncbi:alpha/beta fold hydrolase [Corynebacterium caspium]|uniref:alpha/beta fold hydrolase n=1 Tax=Corynebacterium caspium TaxID=234828 RepID=UPI00035C3A94|nr:alpha/beta fold hydrolase [Corynebacterium caspium]WKD59477.1 Tripeptidyl aminopeptidase precursor [Corynebacterium caspium DSM 44850]